VTPAAKPRLTDCDIILVNSTDQGAKGVKEIRRFQ